MSLRAERCPHCGRRFDAVKCPQCSFMGRADLFTDGCPSCGYLSGKRQPRRTKPAPVAFDPAEGLELPDKAADEPFVGPPEEKPGPAYAVEKPDRYEDRHMPRWAFTTLMTLLIGILIVLFVLYFRL